MACDIKLGVALTSMEYEMNCIVPANVDLGVTMCVEMCSGDHYDGQIVVIPERYNETELQTSGKIVDDDILVTKIPYYETSNLSGGKTAIIA